MVYEQPQRVRALIEALSDPHISVGWNAARDLAKLGEAAKEALPALNAALQSRDPTTALWARYAIAIITRDISSHLPIYIAALADKKRYWAGMAGTALSGFGTEAVAAVAALIEDLRSPRTDDRWAAAWALGSIGSAAKAAVPALTLALEDADEKVRWYAAWALGCLGAEAQSAVPALIRTLDDLDDDVRGYAALALGSIGVPDPDALSKLNQLLDEENPNVHAAALDALNRLR